MLVHSINPRTPHKTSWKRKELFLKLCNPSEKFKILPYSFLEFILIFISKQPNGIKKAATKHVSFLVKWKCKNSVFVSICSSGNVNLIFFQVYSAIPVKPHMSKSLQTHIFYSKIIWKTVVPLSLKDVLCSKFSK